MTQKSSLEVLVLGNKLGEKIKFCGIMLFYISPDTFLLLLLNSKKYCTVYLESKTFRYFSLGFQILAFMTSEKYFSIDPIMMRNV